MFEGAVFLYHGGPEILPNGGNETANTILHSHIFEAGFGLAATGVGDINGDEHDDIVVGNPYFGNNAGVCFIFLGGLEVVL